MKTPAIAKVYTPQCRTVARDLIRRIRDGEFHSGKRIDSIREIVERYQVGYQVAVGALRILSNENYVYKVHGSGTYVNPALRPGLFHRLSFFFSVTNPLPNGRELNDAFLYARNQGFHLLLASNFEDSFTLEDYLKHKEDIDGVAIYGEIDEKLLKYPKSHHVEYVVCGNYDIDPGHPQVTLDVSELYRKTFASVLRKHSFQRIAVFAGTPMFRAEREMLEGVRTAIRECGCELCEGAVIEAEGDGYHEIVEMMKISPDAVFLWDRNVYGILRYLRNGSRSIHPVLIATESAAEKLRSSGYPEVIELKCGRYANIFLKSVEFLIREIQRKKKRNWT